MKDRPETVIFDLDGTLTDSRPGILRSTLYALRRLNETTGTTAPLPEESALDFMIGPPLRATFAGLVGADNVEAMFGFYQERYRKIGLFENEVYEGVPEALQDLSAAGRRLFVATSKNEEDARRILDHFGLARFFAQIYGAQDDGRRAAKAELLGFLIEQQGIDVGAAVMIGDRKFDALGARAVGLPTLGALWGYGSAEELREAGADPLVEAPSGIVGAVEARLGQTGGA